jgi:hypothetical protein
MMKEHDRIKYIHEGKYVAKVTVQLIETEHEWAPYLSLRDAYKLDDVREALRRGDIKAASQQAEVFTMQPIP